MVEFYLGGGGKRPPSPPPPPPVRQWLMRIISFSQQDDTNIINFDEDVLILWPCFLGNVIFKICHFFLKTHNDVPKSFGFPWVSALALKNEDSMNKEKHSLRNFAVLQFGGSYSQNFLPTSWIVTFDTKEAHLTMTVPQKKKNGSRIKTPSSNSKILVSICWRKKKELSTH